MSLMVFLYDPKIINEYPESTHFAGKLKIFKRIEQKYIELSKLEAKICKKNKDFARIKELKNCI